MISLPERPRILVVALRRIGDVLLTTPLVRSLRRAWPKAQIEMLVFSDTAGILEGNPDIDRVVPMPPRPNFGQSLAIAARLAKRYDLAISTQSGDRPTLFSALAGKTSIGPVSANGSMGTIKKFMLSRNVDIVPGLHRVEEVLCLADAIGIERVGEVVCPAGASSLAVMRPDRPYAVLHPAPMFHYKRWTEQGWREVANTLAQRKLEVFITGGPAQEERRYLDGVVADAKGVHRLDGKLTWPQLAALLATAEIFVGPDTSVTHLAAAAGAPTVALYGPTDPRLWGPWPAGGLQTAWEKAGTIQRRQNVWLVQNPLSCLPCQAEGCDRHLLSHSRCLDELSSSQVLAAIDQALGSKPRRSSASA